MQPQAYLILSNLPGQNKLKNLKYFLCFGDNILGSDQRAQIYLPLKYQIPRHALNIKVAYNFITIEAFQPYLVFIEGNLRPGNSSDNFFPLVPNSLYLPKMGDNFYIGRIKCTIGVVNEKQYKFMKNIINRNLFKFEQQWLSTEIKNKEQRKSLSQPIPDKIINHQSNIDDVPQIKFNYTDKKIEKKIQNQRNEEKLSSNIKQNQERLQESQRSSHTQLLQKEEKKQQFQATLVLQEGIYAYEPTLNLEQLDKIIQNYEQLNKIEQKNLQQQKQLKQAPDNKFPVFSQQILLNQIRARSQPPVHQQQIQFSMPDTIVDKQVQQLLQSKKQIKQQDPPQVRIKQIQSGQEINENIEDDQMPPTIKQQQQQFSSQKIKIKPTNTLKLLSMQQQKKQKRLYNSQTYPKQSIFTISPVKQIQDFDDLFGQSPKQANQQKKQQKCSLQNMFVSQLKNYTQVKKQSESKKKQLQEDKMDSLRVHFVGFKPTQTHKDILKKQNMFFVNHPDDDYQILLVKQPLRICNRLLMAIINNKRIQSQQWIFNKNSIIQSKLNGLSWKQINDIKGTHGQPLKGKGRFYISKRLKELFQGVLEALGAQVVQQVSDKKRILNIILRVEDSLDTDLYLQNRNAKKWKFYKSDLITDLVLTGKYVTDDKYLIDLFKDDEDE